MADGDRPFYVFDPECRSGKYIAVEDVINIYDESIWWFYIPGYSGYEISNMYHVRSMKHFTKYPFGMLIRPRKKKDGTYGPDPTYELSNNNNERTNLRLSQIVHLAKSNPYAVFGYPRKTIWTDPASRNMRCFLKRSIPTKMMDQTPRFPKFTVIDEADPEDKFKIKMKNDVVVPIKPLDPNDDTYYGGFIKTKFT